jgi:site-specific DNA-methyltransferase (adenine-specific)
LISCCATCRTVRRIVNGIPASHWSPCGPRINACRAGRVVLTAAQPFTSLLVVSNLKEYKTSWVWNKKQSGGFATAKYHPLKITEDVLVFGNTSGNYHPQMRTGVLRKKGGSAKANEIQSGLKPGHFTFNDQYYPVNLVEFLSERSGKEHPTQKPVALMEYLIRTYTTRATRS